MDATLLPFLVLMTVPITIALLMGGLYWFVRRWKGEVAQAVLQTAQDLETARLEADRMMRVQIEFAAMHRQPYSDLAATLLEHLQAAEQSAAGVEAKLVQLETRRGAPPGGVLHTLINSAPEAYGQRRFVDEIVQERERLLEQLGQGSAVVARLQAAPGEIAEQSRVALAGISAFESLLAEMHAAGLHGRMMDEADDALLRLLQDRVRFPAELLRGEAALSGEAKAVRLTASDLFDLLRDVQPVVGEWLPRVRGWQQQHLRALDALDRLQKNALNFRSALALPPPVLIVTRFQANLLQASAAAGELNSRLGGAEVKDLRGLEREIGNMERLLRDSVAQFDLAVQQVAQLDRLLLELESDFKLIAVRLAEAELREEYPFVWDVSLPIKAELQEKIAGLGTRELKRTPEQVSAALAEGQALAARLAALLARTAEQIERYNALAALLHGPDLAGGAEWVRRALQLGRELAVYDPANWDRAEEVATLGRDLAGLDEQQRRLVPPEPSTALKESGLTKRLEETRALVVLHQRLRPRTDQVRARLAELRKAEKDTRDDLERVSGTLEQVGLLLNGNSYLQETAAVELGKLRAEVNRLSAELEHPGAGPLERKTVRLKALMDSSAKAIGGWVDRLAVNLQMHTRSISEALAALDGVARLDDRVVSDSREMLRRLGPAPAYARTVNYMEAAAALKRCALDWQSAAANAAALEQFSAPVLSAARDAEQARRSVETVLQSAARLTGGRREWPPTRVSLENDAAEFVQLEQRLQALRGQRWTASHLVRELGLIYHALDKIDDHAAQAARSADSERSAAVEIERGIGDLQRRLEVLALRCTDQPALGEEIRELSKQAEQRLSALRAQYRRGGIQYDQALAGMEDLADSLRSARFTANDGTSLGLDL